MDSVLNDYITDTKLVIKDIKEWQEELSKDCIDNIVYEVLDTVLDIIIDHSYEQENV